MDYGMTIIREEDFIPPTKAKPEIEKKDLESGRAWLLYPVLTPEECDYFIKQTEDKGYDESHTFAHFYRSRDNDRLMVESELLSTFMWERIKDKLPKRITNNVTGASWKAVGLNNRWRFCKYGEGQYFGKHCDGDYSPDRDHRSFWTFMVYLNAQGEDYQGGITRFYKSTTTSPPVVKFDIAAKKGAALVFVQNRMLHEGLPLESGQKYIMRSDVMFERAG